MIDALLQIWIIVTGMLAVWLMTSPNRSYMRIACMVGLAGQPAWLYATASALQWGQFAVSLVFTVSYLRGAFPSLFIRKGAKQ